MEIPMYILVGVSMVPIRMAAMLEKRIALW